MREQAKIVLSVTKICVAFGFAIFIVVITTASSKEVTKYLIDQYVSIIAIIFFFDLYLLECEQNTAESFYLQIRYKSKIFLLRILLCEVVSVIIALLSWLLLYIKTQNATNAINISVRDMFIESLFAYAGTTFFFGVFSLTIANIFYNKWIGAITSALLMGLYASTKSETIPPILNIFSFGYLTTNNGFYEDWWVSKIIYIVIAIVLLAINIPIIKQPPRL